MQPPGAVTAPAPIPGARRPALSPQLRRCRSRPRFAGAATATALQPIPAARRPGAVTAAAEELSFGLVLLTSNLAFSKWEQIFKDPMTTAAAVDRLVHHSVIVELNIPSYRAESAKRSKPTES